MKPKLNVRLLNKVKRSIMEHPQNVDMQHWVNHEDEDAECGTAGCIAGWVVANGDLEKLRKLHMPPMFADNEKARRAGLKIKDRAIKLLGLSRRKEWANCLFKIESWPQELYDQYVSLETRKAQAKVVVKVIDRFIELFRKEGKNVRPTIF